MPGIVRSLSRSLVCVLFVPVLVLGQGDLGFNGKWTLIPEKSTEIDLYATLSLEIQQDTSTVTIIQTWGSGRSFKDTLKLKTDGSVNQVPVHDRVWPTNVFIGISMQKGRDRTGQGTLGKERHGP